MSGASESGAPSSGAWLLARDAPSSRAWLQLFRIASLLVPAAIGWRVVSSGDEHDAQSRAIVYVLGPLWCVLAASFARHVVAAILRHRREGRTDVSLLDRIDVLTASGAALSWIASGAIVASASIGWASLSVVGLLGLGIFHFVAIWTLWATAGDDPWRRASLSRRFATERAVEGGPMIEELHFSAPRIPVGFRLFACGRVGPRWATSRYVVDGSDDGSEIRLQSDVGPAVRGAHEAEPLEVWLQDVLGLCHSMRCRAGSASVLVLPRTRTVRGAHDILRARGGLDEPRAAQRAPTEGSLQLREYQPGDDARRIHWARSITAGQTMVRTPDEAPHDEKAVRLVLDTYLPGAAGLDCPASAELLDTLVALWLGVGRSFAEAGVRVELVVAGIERTEVVPLRRVRGLAGRAEDLGARARWQDTQPLEGMLTRGASVVVSYRHQPLPANAGPTLWLLAREWAWVAFDRRAQIPALVCLPHPMGSPENSGARRRRDRRSYWRARAAHARFTRACGDAPGWSASHGAGTWLATPSLGGAIHVEKLS